MDLTYEKKDGVAVLTFNRPERKNALTPETMVRLADAWRDFKEDDSARVAILTGAGDTFTAGADLARLIPLLTRARKPEDDWDRRLMEDKTLFQTAVLRRFELYKPVISAINGAALAGGCEIILATDLRIACPEASLGLSEAKRGIVPGAGSLARLARQIPYCDAMRIMLLGDSIPAAECLRMGLINEIVPRAELMARAHELATKLAANGPLALRKIKEAVLRSSGRPLEEAFDIEDECARVVMRSEDAREGPRAFMEKRPARFVGR
jgi:enoyl-CoA hydratase/carnithine racemase